MADPETIGELDDVSKDCLGKYASLTLLKQTPQLVALHTIIRDKTVSREDFIFYSDRLIRLLVEEGLNQLPYEPKTVTTPTGVEYKGVSFGSHICGVSIVRAGEAMEASLRSVCKSVRIGKILIQRDEATALPHLIYVKLPIDIKTRKVLLMDPMLATGGSACRAVAVLKDHGVPEENIIFLNLIAAPEGIAMMQEKYPAIKIITSQIDTHLNDKKYIIPGIGDFGDLYFGTT
eukprot:CAMPEP_0168601798 /NCGR_PEP_ID=MMETSP0420-20121227/13654_1 /TAXON_ID=498008 /ORGANISM="Pessonella sp." /LENGTH=232 /DNA_ID=CAMNT_0008640269 /DNA_START=33 /DNA_END=731 /DNA_ORIENTATION=-